MDSCKTSLHSCLYFTVNSLARMIARIAEEEFRITGLSPSHAFLLIVVNDRPGIGPTELAQQLQIAPSTVTRFIDNLENRGFLRRQTEGKSSMIFATANGQKLEEAIELAWQNLHKRYSVLLGAETRSQLTTLADEVCRKLQREARSLDEI